MGQLSIYLPPFSGDYAGACQVLFDLNCLMILNDASCCTRNYIDYDEPRWTRTKKTAFCAQLRSIDAILGNDEKLIARAVEAAETLRPDFIAVLGSPVPAIIGTDMKGIAHEVEDRTGLPALGFDTTGFSHYHKGASAALLALLRRFTCDDLPQKKQGVNILGLTPADFGACGNAEALERLLAENGIPVVCRFSMGFTLEQIGQAGSAAVNLVVAQSGFAAARELLRRFGIPYVVGNPVGAGFSETVLSALRASVIDGENRVLCGEAPANLSGAPILIVGEQVISNALRSALWMTGCTRPVTVASFFGIEPSLCREGDLFLEDEARLIKLLKSGAYKTLIADPLIGAMPCAQGMTVHSVPHPAISSHLYWNQVPVFSGEEIEETIRHWVEQD